MHINVTVFRYMSGCVYRRTGTQMENNDFVQNVGDFTVGSRHSRVLRVQSHSRSRRADVAVTLAPGPLICDVDVCLLSALLGVYVL